MRPRVLLTRPEPGAARTAARLLKLGFSPVLLPLTTIVPLAHDDVPNAEDFDTVAVTSANALEHAPADLVARLARLPCFAVGPETAEAARRGGFTQVAAGTANADALADDMLARIAVGATVAYLCGRIRTNTFEHALEQSGHRVRALETYDAPAIAYDRATLDAAIGTEPIHAIMLYSRRAAKLFLRCDWSAESERLFSTARFLCLSQKIAREIEAAAPGRVKVAAAPTDDAMLVLIDET